MAYNFLGLVNDLNRKFNEVELTSSNFATATGAYSQMKDAVNAAIREINQEQFEWPFNFAEGEDTLVAGTVRYSFPSTMKTTDMDSFRIKRNSTFGNSTKKLAVLNYNEYLDRYIDNEYNTSDSGIRALPEYIVRTPNLEYAVVPPPDNAYVLVYDYYSLPTDLDAYTDVPSIPEQFRFVIQKGAERDVYKFRGNSQDAELAENKFLELLKNMRSLYINRYEYVRSTQKG